jgi:hypothetical protein
LLKDGGEVVSLTHWPMLEAEFDPRAVVWLAGLGQLKNPVTSSGIKPTTFWLAA